MPSSSVNVILTNKLLSLTFAKLTPNTVIFEFVEFSKTVVAVLPTFFITEFLKKVAIIYPNINALTKLISSA